MAAAAAEVADNHRIQAVGWMVGDSLEYRHFGLVLVGIVAWIAGVLKDS